MNCSNKNCQCKPCTCKDCPKGCSCETNAIAKEYATKYKVPLEQVIKGMNDEWEEHGEGKFKVLKTKEDAIKTALAHLVKDKHYYNETG